MKIALFCPTRERLENQKRLIESIVKTTSNDKNITLYFGVDDNDPIKKETIELSSHYSFIKIIEIHNNGEFLGLGKLWNLMAKEASEEIFAMIGDDMVFETIGWDEKVLDEFSSKKLPKDNIKLVYCNDGWTGKLAVNSFIHRKYYEITGIYIREEWKHSYHDNWLHDVFTSLNRLIYLKDVIIRHLHFSIPGANTPMDKIYQQLNDCSIVSHRDISYNRPDILKKRVDEIELLKSFIESQIDFSILVLTLDSRKDYLDRLINCLKSQINQENKHRIQILVNNDQGQKFIGRKRNELLAKAKGRYVAFIDDDDLVSVDYIEKILKATEQNPDVIGMHLLMTTDGHNECRTFHSLKYHTWYDEEDETRPGRRKYFRCPNHLNPVKRELALRTNFPQISHGEDKDYSLRLLNLLKTEEYIEEPIYYYEFRTNK